MCSIHFITYVYVRTQTHYVRWWIRYKVFIFIWYCFGFGCFGFQHYHFGTSHWKGVIKIYHTSLQAAQDSCTTILWYTNSIYMRNMKYETPKGRTCWEHWNYYYREISAKMWRRSLFFDKLKYVTIES